VKSKEQPQGERLGRLKNGNPPFDLTKLPRCTAKAKSTGQQCKQPAMKNGKCYWHGGKSPGPPRGNENALKHGHYTEQAIRNRKLVRTMINTAKETIDNIP
jgi:hypothetical protein